MKATMLHPLNIAAWQHPKECCGSQHSSAELLRDTLIHAKRKVKCLLEASLTDTAWNGLFMCCTQGAARPPNIGRMDGHHWNVVQLIRG